MNEVEEIKTRLNIADVVSEYIQLTKAGANYKARCPFHNEKTPSFFVSPDKQIWHCFGACDSGGDIFTFVQKMEGIEFRDALKILANKAGVKLTPRDSKLDSKRTRLLEICAWASRFFSEALWRSREGKIARDYLASRKISKPAAHNFNLGYSPQSWYFTSRFLKKKGFPDQEIREAGLSTQKDSGKFYDRFRGRLMFPISNIYGQVVGFGARVLDEKRDKLGKYINSPQTLIYDKSGVLYGLDKAKTEIKQKNLCIVVEGYLDVITAQEAGTGNVIGVSGTALTQNQLNLIKRYTKNLALCFDADSAGGEAAKRGIENSLGGGLSVRIIVLPRGEDPDSLIKKNLRMWLQAIKNSQEVVDFYFASARASHNPQSLEGKKMIAAEILPLLKRISDPIEQAHYLQRLATTIEMEEGVLRQAMEKINFSRSPSVFRKAVPSEEIEIPNIVPQEVRGRRILGLGLKYPQFLGQILENIKPSLFPSDLQLIYKALKKYYNKTEVFDFSEFKRKIKASYPSYVTKLEVAILDIEKDFEEEEKEEIIAAEVAASLQRLKREYLQRKLKEIELKIRKAEKEGDKDGLLGLTQKFSLLSQELGRL